MTGASAPHSGPDVPWGKVAGVAGGLTAAWLTVRGAIGLARVCSRELHDRLLDGSWTSRRG